jgi:hypothetical protein
MTTVFKWNRAEIAATALVGAATVAFVVSMLTGMSEPTGKVELSPCAAEDSENCYWNAQDRGNGEGTSFIRLDGVTYYPEAR